MKVYREKSRKPEFEPVTVSFVCESKEELEALSFLFNHVWILDAIKETNNVDFYKSGVYAQVNNATNPSLTKYTFNRNLERIFRTRLSLKLNDD